MVEKVWSRARRADGIDRLMIATDDERIRATAARFGAETMMTRWSIPTFTPWRLTNRKISTAW
jgi:3-deoxy-manno-octulosonate cytidylyltransferase (CMP-KDO synthetase)